MNQKFRVTLTPSLRILFSIFRYMTKDWLPYQLVFILFFFAFTVFSQKTESDSLILLLNNTSGKYEKSKLNLLLAKTHERTDITKSKTFAFMALKSNRDSIKSEAHNQLGRAYFYLNQLDSATFHFKEAINLLNKLGYHSQASSVGISLGAVQLRKGDYMAAVSTLLDRAEYFEKIGDTVNLAKCYSNISTAFGELGNSKKAISYGEKALTFFDAKKMLAYKAITLPNLAGEFLKLGDTLKSKSYFLEAEDLAIKRNDKFSLARIYNNLGNMYLETDQTQSEKYLSQALVLREETKNIDGIGVLYNNLGYLNLKKGNPKKAIPYLMKALEQGEGTIPSVVYNNLSDAHELLGNYKNALFYAKRMSAIKDSVLEIEKQKALAEISTKYETEKNEKEILNLQNINLQTDIKRKQNRNLMYTAFSLLMISIVLTYSFIKNSRKKRIIAEQQKQLESQKVEKLLKEQELIGIDAMIEGQENERQRIAEDLHDSLGGKLSALKLFIDEVKNVDQKLYSKLKTLLDESYNDVRNISHHANAAAIIEKGLIPAVNLIAEQLKSANKLSVEVTNIDLNHKVKNIIEIQLYRIIQELLANTIKHANASHVSIQFSEEEDSLNIIYEDDGKGFDTKKIPFGNGLSNIRNRVKKFNGSLTLDAIPGDGTTVIINVPK